MEKYLFHRIRKALIAKHTLHCFNIKFCCSDYLIRTQKFFAIFSKSLKLIWYSCRCVDATVWCWRIKYVSLEMMALINQYKLLYNSMCLCNLFLKRMVCVHAAVMSEKFVMTDPMQLHRQEV